MWVLGLKRFWECLDITKLKTIKFLYFDQYKQKPPIIEFFEDKSFEGLYYFTNSITPFF